MNRDEFLKKITAAALLTCTGGTVVGCLSQNDPSPVNADFTLDLTSGEYSALNEVGGSVSVNGILIARLSTGEFVALSRACTHEGFPVNYRSGQQDFYCSDRGARFSITGAVLQGPASTSLRKFNTELTGSSLRVFS